ncbi:conserved protein of unknown function [Bradyrhizobium sp. ORS 285]|nr:conserved hypothetical protein [Bradyrhizobium sp. ORS 285]SMX61301.1 conserved protein of unknown function [Bradyrhizobium sp. ORS 285]
MTLVRGRGMGSIEAPKARSTCHGALQERALGVRSLIGANRLILHVIPAGLKWQNRSRSSFETCSHTTAAEAYQFTGIERQRSSV